ncbi:MAG: hypothetical protein WEF53_01635 [Bacteroidota bacterium]
MSAYFQMGHDTENLVGERDLEDFGGIVLSPVNREPAKLRQSLDWFKKKGKYDIVLDPQLYFPRRDRGHLQKHPYFPKDLDTADLSSIRWWQAALDGIAQYATDLSVNSVATPAVFPKIWSKEYYSIMRNLAVSMKKAMRGERIKVMSSVMAHLTQLTSSEEVMSIASIMSDSRCDGYYVVLVTDREPRRELAEEEEIAGAMSLIKELKRTGPVTVAYSSSDMLLFKAAGADHCGTGKFFNLRRFTRSRYDEPSDGGGQLPYWFEQSLLAFLRGPDVARLMKDGFPELVASGYSKSSWSTEILAILNGKKKAPWVKMGWCQFLSWFGRSEAEASRNPERVGEWLKSAEGNWMKIEDKVLFDERRNNGSWLRPWRQAWNRFNKMD